MYKFPEDKLQDIKNSIDRALDDEGATPIAAFDADGTLWATDMGETLFKYQYKNGLLEGLPDDPWAYYTKMYEERRDEAYLWLAKINKGIPEDTLLGWSREAVKTHPDMGVFAGQKEVIHHLHLRGVQVYVVTASIRWAVQPAAEIFEIPKENVIGISTKVVDGKITEEQEGPITHSQGKVEGLLNATGGKHAFFASGNSRSDLPLLESSTHLRLVLNSAPQGHDMYETEQEMIRLAQDRTWFWHSF